MFLSPALEDSSIFFSWPSRRALILPIDDSSDSIRASTDRPEEEELFEAIVRIGRKEQLLDHAEKGEIFTFRETSANWLQSRVILSKKSWNK